MKRLRFALVSGVLLTAFLLSAEFVARLYLFSLPQAPSLPPDGIHAEYARMSTYPTDEGYLAYRDYAGRYVNVQNGVRVTVDQPGRYDHTLWLFGNSSAFDMAVADSDTLASQIQRLFNQAGYHLRVMNLGVVGMSARQELVHLTHTPVQPGDTVLFLDGAVDYGHGIRNCDLAGSVYAPVALVELACGALNRLPSWNLSSAMRLYWQSVDQAALSAHAIGAAFYHVEQPCNLPGYAQWLPDAPPMPAPFFVDVCHLNAHGDAILARQLFDRLTMF